ncbi:hypothetical protein LUW77_03545 [Streptomyces radiopugnans]|nr:hypothetical protein LUW77_03545 [Streptomyces radiopugnans]
MAIPGNLLSATTESMDPNTSGWRARANCAKSLGTGGRNGDGALVLTSSAAGEMMAETVTAYPVAPGELYLVFADASSSTQPERIGIEWLTESLTPVGSVTWSMTTASASASWHRVSVAGECPAGATRARVLLSSTASAASRTHFWENVYLGPPIRYLGNLLPYNVESGGELDTSGWTAETNATVARLAPVLGWLTTWYLAGGHLVAVTAVADGDTAMRCTERVVATPGTDYLAYAYLGPPSVAVQPWIELRFYDDGGALLLAERAWLAQPGTGIYRQHVSAVSPASTAEAEIAVGMTAATAGQALWVEGVVVVVAPELAAGTVVPYEDASFEQGVGAWTVASGPGTIARTSPWGAPRCTAPTPCR